MSEKELLSTKSGVLLKLTEVGCRMPLPPDTKVYEIDTDLRSEIGDCAVLTADEATRVAFAILRDRFLKLGKQLMVLQEVSEMFGLEIDDLTLEGDPRYRKEMGT